MPSFGLGPFINQTVCSHVVACTSCSHAFTLSVLPHLLLAYFLYCAYVPMRCVYVFKSPQCLHALREAGIKVCVCTGDKLETAVSIGFSSGLLLPHFEIVALSATDAEGVNRVRYGDAGVHRGTGTLMPIIETIIHFHQTTCILKFGSSTGYQSHSMF